LVGLVVCVWVVDVVRRLLSSLKRERTDGRRGWHLYHWETLQLSPQPCRELSVSSGVDGQTAVPTFTLLPSFPSLQARTRQRPSDSCLTHPQSCQHSINLRDRRRRVRETTPPPPPHVRRFLMGLTPTSHPSKTLDADGIDPRTNSKRTSGPPSSSPAALSGLQTAGEPTDHHHLLPLPLPPDPVVTLRCLGPPTNSNQLIAMSMCPFLDPHRTTHPSQWIKSEVSRAYRGGQPWLPSFFLSMHPSFFRSPRLAPQDGNCREWGTGSSWSRFACGPTNDGHIATGMHSVLL